MFQLSFFISIVFIVFLIVAFLKTIRDRKRRVDNSAKEQFPKKWQEFLVERVWFYTALTEEEKRVFEKRIQLFLATKTLEGIGANVDDEVRLLVAASAIIPTHAFPEYNYPHVNSILIYPNSFDNQYQTKRFEGHRENITGMVTGRDMNSTMILSKPDLLRDFDGKQHNENVGIHEFVHLLDKEDGIVDGIPEELLKHQYVGPWLLEIKKEIDKIEKGKSDINPYALTNNGEFLAVVSEYFFSNPEKFREKHPELYQFLKAIFEKEKA